MPGLSEPVLMTAEAHAALQAELERLEGDARREIGWKQRDVHSLQSSDMVQWRCYQ